MRDEDILEITYVMSDMAKRLLNGEEIPKQKVNVEIEVWEPLIKVIEKIAKDLEIEPIVAFQGLVNEGLNTYLNNGVDQIKEPVQQPEQKQEKPIEEQVLESLGVDLSGLTDQLGKLQSLAQKLDGLQKMFGELDVNHNQLHDTTTSGKKNNT